ncbi:parathyroid hormone-like hormone a [Leucoraja erinacea]|uniref:parathyroid hormone-like hormone a n=1 Tax=Leucoraja erinaceus TaxID=7782 RepID=UPI002456C3A1|nr:parathyroid hormone-like hormone a [Leucoraja erinacea]
MYSQVARGDMEKSGNICQHLAIAIFLLCSSTATHGKPVDGINIKKRSVTEHQFMNDKARTIHALRRRIWLNNVMGEINTAGSLEVAERPLPGSASETVLLINVGPRNSTNAVTRTERREEDKPGAHRHQNARKNGRRKKQGNNSSRRAQKGRVQNRRRARSPGSQPGSGVAPSLSPPANSSSNAPVTTAA